MATKAARGAGFDWGMADEAARATCWLAARDLSGPEALANLLDQLDGKTLSDFAPVTGGAEWSATAVGYVRLRPVPRCWTGPRHCPAARFALGPTLCPLLMWPAVAEVWPGGTLAEPRDLTVMRADFVSVHPGADAPPKATSRAQVPRVVWDRLSTYAQRTYAPATNASRLAGAGAGLSDND